MIGLAAAGAIIAVVAVYFIADSTDASFHAARGLPYSQSVNYFNSGEYEQALSKLNDAIRLDSNDSDAYSYRGQVYGKLGQHQKAIEDLDRALDSIRLSRRPITAVGPPTVAWGNSSRP